MVKFLLGILSGVLLCLFLLLAVALAAAFFSEGEPVVAGGSTLLLELSGDIVERNPVDVSGVLFQRGRKPTLKQFHEILKKAAVDRRVNAIVLKPAGLAAGWGKTQEIRWGLEEFKKSRKPVLAFLETASSRDYYLASVADKVYLAPQGLLDVKGIRAEVMFFKDTLNKLGVEAELAHVGKYKSLSEPFTRNRMSDEYREATNSILDGVLGDFLSTVSAARGMKPEQLRAVLDHGPFLPDQALRMRLADGLLYEDQVLEEIQKLTRAREFKKLLPGDYARVSLSSLGLSGDHRIALVYAVGDIAPGEDDIIPLGSDQTLGADAMARVLREVGQDAQIKGVIVRIDSPGGDSFASDRIWREMNLLRAKKPMVISMSDVAASGGYYMAMTGDPVLAYPSTFTGSIGVVGGKLNLRGLYDKIGVQKEILSRGRFAEIDTDYRPFTPAERGKLMEGMNQVYRDFVQKVAGARRRKWEEIDALAQGRVWLGRQAKQNGLIDELGGYDRAIALVKQRARLKADDKVTLVSYPEEKDWFDLLIGRLRTLSRQEPLASAIRRRIGALAGARVWKVAPYWVVVK